MFALIHQRELFHVVHPSPDHSLTHTDILNKYEMNNKGVR